MCSQFSFDALAVYLKCWQSLPFQFQQCENASPHFSRTVNIETYCSFRAHYMTNNKTGLETRMGSGNGKEGKSNTKSSITEINL